MTAPSATAPALDPRGLDVELPVGLADGAGRLHRHARLRKLTGHDELLLDDGSLSPGRLVTELLRRCLLRLGELPMPLSPEQAWSMTVADRDWLVLQLRRFSLGDQLRASYLCPACGVAQPRVEDLSTVAARAGAPTLRLTLRDGYLDRDGLSHHEIELRLPTGEDQDLVLRLCGGDPARAQDALLLRCITRFGAMRLAELEAYGLQILRDLTLGDRRQLMAALDDALPGVDLRRHMRCDRCGAHFDAVLDATDFFV